MQKKSWKEFRESGFLWFVNRSLHIFGWAIIFVQENDGSISNVYPARVNFRGFSPEAEDRGFERITEFMKDNAEDLAEDLEENNNAMDYPRESV